SLGPARAQRPPGRTIHTAAPGPAAGPQALPAGASRRVPYRHFTILSPVWKEEVCFPASLARSVSLRSLPSQAQDAGAQRLRGEQTMRGPAFASRRRGTLSFVTQSSFVLVRSTTEGIIGVLLLICRHSKGWCQTDKRL